MTFAGAQWIAEQAQPKLWLELDNSALKLSHFQKVTLTVTWLHVGRRLAEFPLENKFNTKFLSVSQLKIIKPNPSLTITTFFQNS